MKKWICIVLMSVLLTGCGQDATIETLGNPCIAEVLHEPKEIIVDLPKQLAAPVLQSEDNGMLYLCEDYTLTVQTLSGGDLNATIKECTGFSRDELTVIETAENEWLRYDCVWSSMGEKADEVGKMAILDDGSYHYVITVMASSEHAQHNMDTWNEIFASFNLDTDQ